MCCWEVAGGVVTLSPRDLHEQLGVVIADGVPPRAQDVEALD